MVNKASLFLILTLMSILLVNPLTSGNAFADDDKKKTFEEMCAKKKGNSPDALFCQAILGLQQSTNSFFDIFTELRLADTDLQNQIDSFENQDCDDGYYMSGIDEDGQIKCKPLPSDSNLFCGDSIVTAPETCDDGNTTSGDGCSAICTAETTDLCLGVDVDDGNECTTDTCSAGVVVHTDNEFCTEAVCGDGLVSGAEQCDDGNFANGDGCSDVCSIEGCNADTNPVCTSALTIPSVSGDLGNDFRVITDNSENWYSLTIREDSSVSGESPESFILLEPENGDDYDLYVYCETCGGTLIGSSTFPSDLRDFVSVRSIDDSIFGADDTFTVLIEVRAVSVNSCSDYTLTVQGNIISEDLGDLGLC